MPLYLQTLRGRTALGTGLILLPMAITGGIATIIAGRLYDRLGPRPLLAFGFGMLMVNTWQLSQIRADTPVSYILLLLALRGLAFGSTIQTTFVTALSVVPLKEIAQGSSLTNATRLVVQSLGVAILATVLVSTLSPQVSALQQQFQDQPQKVGQPPVALCTVTAPTSRTGPTLVSVRPQGQLPPGYGSLLQQACQQNIAGFELAYRITFFAAVAAFILGVMLPGWPFKWAGRRAADMPPSATH
jgi:hypothetical protein